MEPQDVARRVTTILAADVVGYGRLSQVGKESTHRCLGVYIDAITALIDRRYSKVM